MPVRLWDAVGGVCVADFQAQQQLGTSGSSFCFFVCFLVQLLLNRVSIQSASAIRLPTIPMSFSLSCLAKITAPVSHCRQHHSLSESRTRFFRVGDFDWQRVSHRYVLRRTRASSLQCGRKEVSLGFVSYPLTGWRALPLLCVIWCFSFLTWFFCLLTRLSKWELA